jgi:hypothetical protein
MLNVIHFLKFKIRALSQFRQKEANKIHNWVSFWLWRWIPKTVLTLTFLFLKFFFSWNLQYTDYIKDWFSNWYFIANFTGYLEKKILCWKTNLRLFFIRRFRPQVARNYFTKIGPGWFRESASNFSLVKTSWWSRAWCRKDSINNYAQRNYAGCIVKLVGQGQGGTKGTLYKTGFTFCLSRSLLIVDLVYHGLLIG